MIEMVPAISEAIDMFVYDDQQLVLTISFVSGSRYEYAMVPPRIFEEFKAAGSRGRYFIAEIRNFFPYARVG
jgi:lysyl-tRNA synthetase class 2